MPGIDARAEAVSLPNPGRPAVIDAQTVGWRHVDHDPLAYLRDPANGINRPLFQSADTGYWHYYDEMLESPRLTDTDRRILLKRNHEEWGWRIREIISAKDAGLYDMVELPSVDAVREHAVALGMVCDALGLYEYPTREYVSALGGYLDSEIRRLSPLCRRPVKVLEVGAGQGVLAWHVGWDLETRGYARDTVIATDSYEYGKIPNQLFPVEELDTVSAIRKYGTDSDLILISSWMSPNENWTQQMIRRPAVKEIILVGPTDECIGGPGTFDNKPGFETVDVGRSFGFPRQFSQFDEGRAQYPPRFDTQNFISRTLAFRRILGADRFRRMDMGSIRPAVRSHIPPSFPG